jgi:TPR repeat protein
VPKEISMTVAKRNKTDDPENFLLSAERLEESGDFKSAFKSLLAGALSGDSSCQANLGNFYASGKGTTKSLEKAAFWYKRAYRNGSGYAASNLAIDRRNAGNIRSAVFWFKRAIAQKDGDACILLAKLYSDRKGGRKAAVSLLRRALRMNRNYLSESGRDEAESLLKKLTSQTVPSPD